MPGPGARISPEFAPVTLVYRVTLPSGASETTLTPTVLEPGRATIAVDGSPVASGSAVRVVVGPDFAPRTVSIVVTTESGATRSYTVAVVRGSTYFKASNTGTGDQFGSSVALSADGSTLAVGAFAEDSSASGIGGDGTGNSAMDAGAVYLFRRGPAGLWSQEAYVKASNPGVNDSFGSSVALSADGATLAVGAAAESSSASGIGGDPTSDAAPSSGAVYLFRRSAFAAWSQEAYIKASNTGASDAFGRSVALSADGTTLAVGAWAEKSNATGIDGDQANNSAFLAGATYVFRLGSSGAWSQEAYVKASNTDAGDWFGTAVALSADGMTLVVGAHGEASASTGIDGDPSNNDTPDAGALYVFQRSVTGAWSQEAYVKAGNADPGDWFGFSVALSADGRTLAVGAPNEDSSAVGVDGDPAGGVTQRAGAVYVLRRSDTGRWSQEAYVKASNTGEFDAFGHSVSISTDGDVLAVGARYERSGATGLGGDQTQNDANDAGAAYVFRRAPSGVWSQEAYIKASNPGVDDEFGRSVALSGDGATLAVGATGEDSSARGLGGDQSLNAALNSGAVYVY